MRKANVDDMFNIVQLISDLKVEDYIYEVINELEKEDKSKINADKVGFKVISNILRIATTSEAREKVYSCLSGPFEMSVDDIKQMNYIDFGKALGETIDFKTLIGFFK